MADISAAGRRGAHFVRNTKETSITVDIDIDGNGLSSVKTDLYFLDHLITTLAKHSMLNVELAALSNDHIVHHIVEDTAIALSQAIDRSLLERKNIRRFGYASVPMDDSLASVSIDLVKRQFHKVDLKLSNISTEGIQKEDLEHFVRSLLQNLNACTHVIVEYGDNDHHKIEAALKAFAVAFRMAVTIDSKSTGVPSTKGEM
ncbi:MAG TPA: imidazoleglycerol-phosphate dehydratase [Nitrososphaeraceae archaeon]